VKYECVGEEEEEKKEQRWRVVGSVGLFIMVDSFL